MCLRDFSDISIFFCPLILFSFEMTVTLYASYAIKEAWNEEVHRKRHKSSLLNSIISNQIIYNLL